MTTNDGISRRALLGTGGATLVAGTAGCLSSITDGEDGSGQFTVGEIGNADTNCLECISPSPSFAIADRIEDETDGELVMNVQPDNQICDSTSCGTKAQSNVIEAGYASIGNSTAFFPENQIWLVPYTFPSAESITHTLAHEDAWENFWIPFARKYNILPFYYWTPALRDVFISDDGTDMIDGDDLRRPEQLEGMIIRRTESRVADESLATWGASPTEVSWGDAVQGMETGVIDGLETWSSVAIGSGMGSVIDQVVDVGFKCGQGTMWVNTNWLQSLSDDRRELLADATRELTEEAVAQADELVDERVGQQDSPPEGSAWNDLDVTVNVLDDDEQRAWIDPLDPQENPEMWAPERELLENFEETPDGFYDRIYEIAREDDAPDSPEEFSIDAWWDDYLEEV
ncbi:ABC transporter substrate-binding protein [Natronococcus pandeyae]|uniref:ABC transporter substrate-binding protein n=1 Tax=Natronococcus pandeyae TaxID=2055836 RepID=A0A8J8TNX4_9EURY|nr:TRAP transporter substrate-binding protein DctP [Natronococcus pandeyae]TYL36788.1 ABC transporter substrate-binding protein [Natronococcus pandeyae]